MIANKIYKTGQTRGADKDTIYQNRVLRNSTVIIPFDCWNEGEIVPEQGFENGYIVIIRPKDYFENIDAIPDNLILGENMVVDYETREEWNNYSPIDRGWNYATSRKKPLGGQYIARVPDTTNTNDTMIRYGFTNAASGGQGAGIRVYEYASTQTLELTRYQLAFLAWRTEGIIELSRDIGGEDPGKHREYVESICNHHGLLNYELLERNRLLIDGRTVCPLCLKPIRAIELASRSEQAEGRFVADLTITGANMFHNRELRVGEYNHKTYNLGWGHHHCNIVVADFGIDNIIQWMAELLNRNGYEVARR